MKMWCSTGRAYSVGPETHSRPACNQSSDKQDKVHACSVPLDSHFNTDAVWSVGKSVGRSPCWWRSAVTASPHSVHLLTATGLGQTQSLIYQCWEEQIWFPRALSLGAGSHFSHSCHYQVMFENNCSLKILLLDSLVYPSAILFAWQD